MNEETKKVIEQRSLSFGLTHNCTRVIKGTIDF